MRVSSDALRGECPASASAGVKKPAAGYRTLSLISLSSSFTPKGRGHRFATGIEPGGKENARLFSRRQADPRRLVGIKGVGMLPASARELGQSQSTMTGPVKTVEEHRDVLEELRVLAQFSSLAASHEPGESFYRQSAHQPVVMNRAFVPSGRIAQIPQPGSPGPWSSRRSSGLRVREKRISLPSGDQQRGAQSFSPGYRTTVCCLCVETSIVARSAPGYLDPWILARMGSMRAVIVFPSGEYLPSNTHLEESSITVFILSSSC
jgi:hypothetical protein